MTREGDLFFSGNKKDSAQTHTLMPNETPLTTTPSIISCAPFYSYLYGFAELASSAKGGKVLETSDELFGEGFHLIKDEPAIEDKNRETANGFWKVKTTKVYALLHTTQTLSLICLFLPLFSLLSVCWERRAKRCVCPMAKKK
jgi:hypothetical protein